MLDMGRHDNQRFVAEQTGKTFWPQDTYLFLILDIENTLIAGLRQGNNLATRGLFLLAIFNKANTLIMWL